MLQAGDRPGAYFDEWSEENRPIKQNQKIKEGERAGGKWRGVQSGRNMQPFMRENPDLNPGQVEKALRNKDSAAYRKVMDRAVDFIRREAARKAQNAGITGNEEELPEGAEDFPFGANR